MFAGALYVNIGELAKEKWSILLFATLGVVISTFVLIGLVIHLLNFNSAWMVLGMVVVAIVLLSRFISVFIPYSLLKHKEQKPIKTVLTLTWGGLRGGISIALAMSLADNPATEVIQFITYIVVLFSIIVQGLSIGAFVKKLYN